MKNYKITVNGNVYDVTVEEKDGAASSVAPITAAAPKPSPKAAAGAGDIKIEAGAAGKVFKVEATAGTTVKAGETIVVLEVMKMETPVVAPKDGVVASIEVSEGQAVEAGALLATMKEA